MTLIKWRPICGTSDREKFFEEMPIMSRKMFVFTPAAGVYQDKNNVIVETPLAGIDPEKVSISAENGVLRIAGKVERKSEVDEKNYYRKEVRFGSFYRSVALPAYVKADNAKASYENGILRIVAPKAEEAEPKAIKISVKKIKNGLYEN